MENRNTISDELRDISPVVAGIGHQNLYTVPPAYFDGLAVQVMLRIAMEEKAGTDPVLNINKGNVYQVPEAYFDSLAYTILQRIKAEQAGNTKEELEFLSPLLGQLAKKNPFSAPDGYFADFSDNIVAGVKAVDFVNEELENLSPTMLSLKTKQVYEVPEGYFNTTAAIILEKAKQQQPAKIFSIGFGRKAMQYAAAAAVTGILVFAGYFYSGKKAAPVTDIPTAMASIPDHEVENFLDNNTVPLADIGAEADTVNTAKIDADGGFDDTKDLLADISDEELQKYVDQQSETPVTN